MRSTEIEINYELVFLKNETQEATKSGKQHGDFTRIRSSCFMNNRRFLVWCIVCANTMGNCTEKKFFQLYERDQFLNNICEAEKQPHIFFLEESQSLFLFFS